MRSQVNLDRLILFSEYLDGRLHAKDQAGVDALLASDTGANTEMAAIRSARQLLRLAPHRPAPRNFTLKPAIVRTIRRDRRAIPLLGTSGLLSTSLALALFLFAYFPQAIQPEPVAVSSFAVEMAPAAPAPAAYTVNGEPIIITWGVPAAGGRGGGGGAVEPAVAAETFSLKSPAAGAPIEQAAPQADTLAVSDYPPITGSGPILGVFESNTAENITARGATAVNYRGIGINILLLFGLALSTAAYLLRRRRYQ
jgi:hypothetical protein